MTSQELFITWLALSLPLVSASQLRMADDDLDGCHGKFNNRHLHHFNRFQFALLIGLKQFF